MGIPVEADHLVQGACEIQTAVPLLRPSRAMCEEERQLAGQEAAEIPAGRITSPGGGEEVLLTYGFLADRTAIP